MADMARPVQMVVAVSTTGVRRRDDFPDEVDSILVLPGPFSHIDTAVVTQLYFLIHLSLPR